MVGDPLLASQRDIHNLMRTLLRAFVLSGRTDKETAEGLREFCDVERGPWIHPDHNDNNAAPLASPSPPPAHSPGLSISSCRSSQNPATQPQTPTTEQGHQTLAQQYRLRLDDHQPQQDGYVELRKFLLLLLAPAPAPAPGLSTDKRQKIKDLYDMSTLPGHGTRDGFDALEKEAAAHATPTGLPKGFGHSLIGDPTSQRYSPERPIEAQGYPFRPHQSSHSPDRFSYHVHPAHVPVVPDRTRGQQQQQHTGNHQVQAPVDQSQVDNNPPPSISPAQISTQQDNNNNAVSPNHRCAGITAQQGQCDLPSNQGERPCAHRTGTQATCTKTKQDCSFQGRR